MANPSYTWEVLGRPELTKAFANLSQTLQTSMARRVVNLASNPQLKRARTLAPRERNADDKINYIDRRDIIGKQLHKSLVKRVKYNKRTGETYSFVGADAKSGAMFYLHLAEEGAKPHTIIQNAGVLRYQRYGSKNFTKVVYHPGKDGTHFLKRSGNSTKRDQLNILQVELKKSLDKHAVKMASKSNKYSGNKT